MQYLPPVRTDRPSKITIHRSNIRQRSVPLSEHSVVKVRSMRMISARQKKRRHSQNSISITRARILPLLRWIRSSILFIVSMIWLFMTVVAECFVHSRPSICLCWMKDVPSVSGSSMITSIISMRSRRLRLQNLAKYQRIQQRSR